MVDPPRIAVVGSDVSLVVGLTMAMPNVDIIGYGTPEGVERGGFSAVVLSAATTGECLDLAERLGLANVPCVAIGDEAFDGPEHFEVFTRPLNRARLVEHLRALVADADAAVAVPALPADGNGGGGRGVLGFLRRPRGRPTDVAEPPHEEGDAAERPEPVVEDAEPDAVDEDARPETTDEDDTDDVPMDPDGEVDDGEAVSDPHRDVDATASADELAVASAYVAETVALAAGVAIEAQQEVEDDEQQSEPEPEAESDPEPPAGPHMQPGPQPQPEPQPELQPEEEAQPAAVEPVDPAAVAALFADLNAPLPAESPQTLVEHLAADLDVETAVVWEADPDGHLGIVAASGLSRLERRAWIPREHVLATLLSRGPGGVGHAVLDTTAGGVVRLSTHDPRLRNVVGIGPAVNLAVIVEGGSTPRLVVVASDDVDAAAFAAVAN